MRARRRTACLKYLVIANMLMKSAINPFDSQEAKPYRIDPEILAMTNLVTCAHPPSPLLCALLCLLVLPCYVTTRCFQYGVCEV